MIDDKQLSDAIHATVAKDILERLPVEARDALILKSVTAAIKDYRVTGAIAESAAERAKVIADKLMSSPAWIDRVETAIRNGMEDYLKQLRAATTAALKETMSGREGSYGSAGIVLRHWPKEEDQE